MKWGCVSLHVACVAIILAFLRRDGAHSFCRWSSAPLIMLAHLLSRRLHWILWLKTCAQVAVQDKEEGFGFRSMETFCFSSSFPLEYTAPKSVLCCSSYQSWNWKVVPKIGKCHQLLYWQSVEMRIVMGLTSDYTIKFADIWQQVKNMQ